MYSAKYSALIIPAKGIELTLFFLLQGSVFLFAEVEDLLHLQLSDPIFNDFQMCMKANRVVFENLPAAPRINAFISCCNERFIAERNFSQSQYSTSAGEVVDGRDIISMSALDIKKAFDIDASLAWKIYSFISRTLTAQIRVSR
jgi:hypothetical protein